MTLRATGTTVRFGDSTVLDDISLAVNPGEVLTVIGPSGTGKTTLLRHLALFRRPDSGTVSWNGTDLWELPKSERFTFRRRLSVVFQEPALFNATVQTNVTYGVRVRQSWRSRLLNAIRTEPQLTGPVRSALRLVGLEEKVRQNALALSGGEAQRVAFARALAVEPEFLFLDEPTSNLDPRNTAVLERAIRRAKDRGVGVVVATHDMHQAERLSDRVGFLFDGELVETGPPEQLFAAPTDPRTERFIDGELVYPDAHSDADGAERRQEREK